MRTGANDKDLDRASAAVVKALDLLSLPDISPLPVPGSHRPDEIVQVPVMMRGVDADGRPIIGLRFLDDGELVIEALYRPLMMAATFLEDARGAWAWRAKYYDATEEQLEEAIFETAVDMLVILLQKLNRRMSVAMESLALEALEEWHSRQSAFEETQLLARGIKVRLKDASFRGEILKGEANAVRELWGWGQGGSDKQVVASPDQKKQFASEYPEILKHWEMLNQWYRQLRLDSWRKHAKVDYPDTPDDLLSEFEEAGPERLSYFALEHAARRAGIKKTDKLDPKTIELRKCGVAASGCSRATLYNILKEGENLNSLNQPLD